MADDLDIGNEVFTTADMKPSPDDVLHANRLAELAANFAVTMMHRAVIIAHQKIYPGESLFYDREFPWDGRFALVLAVKDVTAADVVTLTFADIDTGDTYVHYGATIDKMIELIYLSDSYLRLDPRPFGSGQHDSLYIRAISGGGFEVFESDTDSDDLTFNLIMICIG